MELKTLILAEHSKAQTDKIVKWIGNDPKRFDELFHLFYKDDGLVSQRAAWVLSNAVNIHPDLITKHFPSLLKKIKQKNIHDAIKRNGIRLMQHTRIPKKYEGDVMNLCFEYILDPREKPAIKAFSLSVLQQLSRQYPDIKNELKLIIESQWEQESAAFRSRARKILRQI